MLRICYISTARSPIDEAMLDSILSVSRRNNRDADVSGLLVAGQRRFLQMLEGPEAAVRQTYARISRDPRHYACVVIDRQAIADRQAEQWDMGLVRPDGSGAEAAALDRLVAAIDDRNLRAQFEGFLALNRRQRSAA